MCSTKPDVDHLVLTEAGGVDGIGDVEINEWSELLTNEQEIAVTQRIPVSLASITDNARRINGKFKRIESKVVIEGPVNVKNAENPCEHLLGRTVIHDVENHLDEDKGSLMTQ